MQHPTNLIEHYLRYVEHTESPYNYHRWCIIGGINVLLGRGVYTDHGHSRIFPNNFTLLVGEPASRKSTSILLTKKLLAEAGYTNFAASKTTRERFFLDLAGIEVDDDSAGRTSNSKRPNYDSTTELNLFGEIADRTPREAFIAADEFTTFTRMGNMEFFDDLGQMWDWDSETILFEDRVKNSKSVKVYQPTINILAGTTSENFNRAFPPETLGTGFLSRLLLIYGKRSERKYAFPKTPSEQEKAELVNRLASIRGNTNSNSPRHVRRSPGGEKLLEDIYYADSILVDPRFSFFTQRRFTHLLKLCLTVSVALGKDEIDEEVAIVANTYLTAAEFSMPNAIGEFGKSKNSDVADKIVKLLEGAIKPLPITEIWKNVMRDIGKMADLVNLMQGLETAKRVQLITGPRGGFLPFKEPAREAKYVDWNLLTKEEKETV